MASSSIASRVSDTPRDVIAQEAGARMTVRRASGQRAESESMVGMRRNNTNRQLARRVSTSSHAANNTAKQSTGQDDTTSSAQSIRSSTSTSRSLANGVRKIFRSRSKSQSTPSRSAARTEDPDAIPEGSEDAPNTSDARHEGEAAVANANATQNSAGALASHARRSVESNRRSRDMSSYKSSGIFSFGRAKTPPRSKVDWEGVEAEIHRSSVSGRGSLHLPPLSTGTMADGKGKAREQDTYQQQYSSWSPYDTPKPLVVHLSDGIPPTSSDGAPTAVFDIVGNGTSRGHPSPDTDQHERTFAPRSPARRSSLPLSDSVTPKRGAVDLPQLQSGRASPTTQTPTPTNAHSHSLSEDVSSKGLTTATGHLPSLTKVNTNVPKMWQISDNSHRGIKDDSSVQNDSLLGKQRYGSSTTTGSISSFRTALSFRDGETPESSRHPYGADAHDPATTIARSTSSPLSDLIDHLDQQLLPSTSSTPTMLHRSVPLSDRLAELRRPNITPSPVSIVQATSTNRDRVPSRNADMDQPRNFFPGNDQKDDAGDDAGDDDNDEDESTFSRISGISSSSHASQRGKRNTFGAGEAFDTPAAVGSRTTTAKPIERPSLAEARQFADGDDNGDDEDGLQGRRDVSMYEIETSLAAVEAALHDHSVAGSLDPNPLLAHILTPRHAVGRLSNGDVSAYRSSSGDLAGDGVDDDYFPQSTTSQASPLPTIISEDEERLARITLPPEQQDAIADAVRQVRRAISSSQLPQIPNEDESDASRSPLAEVMLGTDTAAVGSRSSVSVLSGVGQNTNGEAAAANSGTSQLEHFASSPPLPLPLHGGVGLVPDVQPRRSAESTPMRAARHRQESMQDVEQAYARMVELVTSAAGIDLTPSPMPAMRFLTGRRSTQSQVTPATPSDNVNVATFEPRSSASSYVSHASPLQQQQQRYVRDRTQSAAPTPTPYQGIKSEVPSVLRPLVPPAPPLPPIAATSSRSARQQLLRESDALSRFMGHLPDLSEEASENTTNGLRGRSSNVSLGSRSSRRAASESPPRYYQRELHAASLAQFSTQQDFKANATDRTRSGNEVGTSSSAAGSGGGATTGTSLSHTIRMQGKLHTPAAEDHNVPVDAATITYMQNRSSSQQAHDLQTRSRYSSPSSTRFPQEQEYEGAGANASVLRPLNAASTGGGGGRQTDENVHRRLRAAQLSGTSSIGRDQYGVSTGHHSPGYGSVTGSLLPESVSNSYRRSGSIRDWGGRLEELANSINRPLSNASGTYAAVGRSHAQRGLETGSGDASDAGRLAHLQSRISSPTSSLSIMQRRHALERDSLLDMLDRTRSEAMDTRARNERLEADLHLEVTRVLELERELQRQRDREDQLASRVQALEEELKAEQADRERIGVLLERVQRAVDEAATARESGGVGQHNQDDESMSNDSNSDEVMEMVQGQHGRDERSAKREAASSPTSSSMSILQEDLFPIKRRVFDALGAEAEARLGPSSSVPITDLHLHHFSRSDTTRDESESSVDAVDLLDVSGDNGTYKSDAEFDRSPSLQSHTSVLGIQAKDHELDWSLDEERPPEMRDATPPDYDGVRQVNNTSFATPEQRREASHNQALSASDDGVTNRTRLPSVLNKRVSLPPQHSPSRLPVLSSKSSAASSTAPFVHGTGAMSKSFSGGSTAVPSTSATSIDDKWRFPSVLSTSSARPSIAKRMESSGNSLRYVNGSGNSSSFGESSPPPSPSLRHASLGSRTTGGDTSYTAQTISPIGSFIPTFPTMTNGDGRRSSSARHQEQHAFTASGRIQSPPMSPSRRQAAFNATHSKVPLSTAMRSAGGYYDIRRPPGYDPVDTSVLDALSGEDSSFN